MQDSTLPLSETLRSQAALAQSVNIIVKKQHEILAQELARIEELDAAIVKAQKDNQQKHQARVIQLERAEVFLQEHLKKKQELLRQLQKQQQKQSNH